MAFLLPQTYNETHFFQCSYYRKSFSLLQSCSGLLHTFKMSASILHCIMGQIALTCILYQGHHDILCRILFYKMVEEKISFDTPSILSSWWKTIWKRIFVLHYYIFFKMAFSHFSMGSDLLLTNIRIYMAQAVESNIKTHYSLSSLGCIAFEKISS